MTRDEIRAAALQLPEDERLALATELLGPSDFDEDVEAAWGAEIAQRLADMDAGRVQMIPAEEVFASLRRQSLALRARRAG